MPVYSVQSVEPEPKNQPGWDMPGTYESVHSAFQWDIPEVFNIAQVCCRRWVASDDDSKHVAVMSYQASAGCIFHSYFELADQANRLSRVLQ